MFRAFRIVERRCHCDTGRIGTPPLFPLVGVPSSLLAGQRRYWRQSFPPSIIVLRLVLCAGVPIEI